VVVQFFDIETSVVQDPILNRLGFGQGVGWGSIP
jgi:hypothetical protein